MKNNEILVTYWNESKDIINFGENIPEVIIKHFGYKLIKHDLIAQEGDISKYDSCLLMIGSWIFEEVIDKIKTKKLTIWGDGAGSQWGTPVDMMNPSYKNKLDINITRIFCPNMLGCYSIPSSCIYP